MADSENNILIRFLLLQNDLLKCQNKSQLHITEGIG